MSEAKFDPTGFTIQCNTCLSRKMVVETDRRAGLVAKWEAKSEAEKLLERRPSWTYSVDHDVTKAELQPWASGTTFRQDIVRGGFNLVCTESGCGQVVHEWYSR